MSTIGRRYSRRESPAPGLEAYDAEMWHIFSGATARYKEWALEYLEAQGIAARRIAADATVNGWLNEGAVLRESVSCIEGTENDSGIMLAAHIYEVARRIEEYQAHPDLAPRGQCVQDIFALGRISMLARVYGIDDQAVAKRVNRATKANRKFTDADRARWRQLRAVEYGTHSKSRAAALIAAHEGLPATATESVRKAI